MIDNEKSYQIAKELETDFLNRIILLEKIPVEEPQIHQLLHYAETDGLRSKLIEIQDEILQYERNTDRWFINEYVIHISELPFTLLQIRQESGLSDEEFAGKFGLPITIIQEYEDTYYFTAPPLIVEHAMAVLGVKLQTPSWFEKGLIPIKSLFKRLDKIGVKRDFIRSRLLPEPLVEFVDTLEDNKAGTIMIAGIIGKIYNWEPSDFKVDKLNSLSIDSQIINATRFKTPSLTNAKKLAAYTVYAHYLALLVIQCSNDLDRKEIPREPARIRSDILREHSTISFESTLRYVWCLGIPVLPLSDHGNFSGACWREDGRNIIVLKQNSKYSSRWIFDLFHELYHLAQKPSEPTMSYIEPGEDGVLEKNEDEELAASRFAGDILLDGRAEDLYLMSMEIARNNVPRLKRVVTMVAQQQHVSQGALANYIANRLSIEGHNWWGTATNLQPTGDDGWEVAQEYIMSNITLESLAPTDKTILLQVINPEGLINEWPETREDG